MPRKAGEEGGDDVKISTALNVRGDTRVTMEGTAEATWRQGAEPENTRLSSDRSLKPDSVKRIR